MFPKEIGLGYQIFRDTWRVEGGFLMFFLTRMEILGRINSYFHRGMKIQLFCDSLDVICLWINAY